MKPKIAISIPLGLLLPVGHAFFMTTIKTHMFALLLLLATSCTSHYDNNALSSVKSLALVRVSGEWSDSTNMAVPTTWLRIYANALDTYLHTNTPYAYVPLAVVTHNERPATGAVAIDNTGIHNLKRPLIHPDVATKHTMCVAHHVDALLISHIMYFFNTSPSGDTLHARPTAALYVPERDEPVWVYNGPHAIPTVMLHTPMRRKLTVLLKEAADLSTEVNEAEASAHLQNIPDKDVSSLAREAAVKLSQELTRVLEVSRGRRSANIYETAVSGTWGRAFEWKAMAASGVFAGGCLGLLIVFAIVGRSARHTGDTEDDAEARRAIYVALVAGLAWFGYEFLKAML